MNSELKKSGDYRAGIVYSVAVIGALLIAGLLVQAMIRYTRPEPLNANRAAERTKALAEIRQAEADALEHTGWIDQGKGIVRLPISHAMTLVERDWGRNPAAARSNLVARAQQAAAAPPAPPETPSQFE